MNAKRFPIPDNVADFIDVAAAAHARHEATSFSEYLWLECGGMESPIEQLFMAAIHVVSSVNLVDLSVAEQFVDDTDRLLIIPQWQVGKYRADFALRRFSDGKIVVVELDGHEFHDRDERQRRYEKTRDRFFTASGYSVLHFTGAEIVKDPCAAALEAFNLATGLGKVSIHPLKEE